LKKLLFIVLAVVLALSVGLIGCTPSEQEEEEEEEENPLTTIVNAAEDEGEVTFFCGGMGADALSIRNGVYNTFGVLLDVSVVPGSGTAAMAQIILEREAEVPLSYDFWTAGIAGIIHDLNPNDLQMSVNWTPLFAEIGFGEDDFTYYPAPIDNVMTTADIQCWIYNTNAMNATDLPENFLDIADPEWAAWDFGWTKFATLMSNIAYCYGMDNSTACDFFCDIRANGGLMMKPEQIAAECALGSLDFGYSMSKEYSRYITNDPAADIAIAFPHDFMYIQENFFSVIKGCEHPNAAILCVLWMLTPDGQEWLVSVYGAQNPRDPLSPEYGWIADQIATYGEETICHVAEQEDFLTWYSDPVGSQPYVDQVKDAIDGVTC